MSGRLRGEVVVKVHVGVTAFVFLQTLGGIFCFGVVIKTDVSDGTADFAVDGFLAL